MTYPVSLLREVAGRLIDDEVQIIDAPGPAPEPKPTAPEPRELTPERAWQMNEAAQTGARKLTKPELRAVRKAYLPDDVPQASKSEIIRDIAEESYREPDQKLDPQLMKWVKSLRQE